MTWSRGQGLKSEEEEERMEKMEPNNWNSKTFRIGETIGRSSSSCSRVAKRRIGIGTWWRILNGQSLKSKYGPGGDCNAEMMMLSTNRRRRRRNKSPCSSYKKKRKNTYCTRRVIQEPLDYIIPLLIIIIFCFFSCCRSLTRRRYDANNNGRVICCPLSSSTGWLFENLQILLLIVCGWMPQFHSNPTPTLGLWIDRTEIK